jgi:hypothetical protein
MSVGRVFPIIGLVRRAHHAWRIHGSRMVPTPCGSGYRVRCTHSASLASRQQLPQVHTQIAHSGVRFVV